MTGVRQGTHLEKRVRFFRPGATRSVERASMSEAIVGLDHVQVAAPPGCEAEARRFYAAVLVPAAKAHPALRVSSRAALERLARALDEARADVMWADPPEIPGTTRFFVRDPRGEPHRADRSSRARGGSRSQRGEWS